MLRLESSVGKSERSAHVWLLLKNFRKPGRTNGHVGLNFALPGCQHWAVRVDYDCDDGGEPDAAVASVLYEANIDWEGLVYAKALPYGKTLRMKWTTARGFSEKDFGNHGGVTPEGANAFIRLFNERKLHYRHVDSRVYGSIDLNGRPLVHGLSIK